jgi:adenosylmethionine-8-amino-7-oxononanoate aminotransferase
LCRELCDEFDVLLIADEIATGFGRTGKLFACEHADIVPDIICLGKALSGGYITLAATVCCDKVANGIANGSAPALMHGPTFMANPLACAVALASTQMIAKGDWQQQVSAIERQLHAELPRLRTLPQVVDVRILGAVGVVELNANIDVATAQRHFVELGVCCSSHTKLI